MSWNVILLSIVDDHDLPQVPAAMPIQGPPVRLAKQSTRVSKPSDLPDLAKDYLVLAAKTGSGGPRLNSNDLYLLAALSGDHLAVRCGVQAAY
jgi:hypothetical protein